MQRFVPRQTCFREKVMGGQGECFFFFFFFITITTASFVPNVFFKTDYQELAPDRSNTNNYDDDD